MVVLLVLLLSLLQVLPLAATTFALRDSAIRKSVTTVPIGPRERVSHKVREPAFGHIFGETTLPVDDFAESLIGQAA